MPVVAKCMPADVNDNGDVVVRGNGRGRPPLRYDAAPTGGERIFIWKIEEGGGAGLAARGTIQSFQQEGRNYEIQVNIENQSPSRPLNKGILKYLVEQSSHGEEVLTVAKRIYEHAPACITAITPDQADWLDKYYEPLILSSEEAQPPEIDPEQEKALQTERERSWRLQEERPGQGPFRDGLIRRDGGRCAVTRCSVLCAVEAGHLKPFAEHLAERENPRNGILLRADIHILFDRGLMAVHPETRELWIAKALSGTSYERFCVPGRQIRTGAGEEYLRYHFKWARDRDQE